MDHIQTNTSQKTRNGGKQTLEIDRYGFFRADTDILAIHGPIADISKFFISCFLLHYQKYYVFYALPFLQKLQKSGFLS